MPDAVPIPNMAIARRNSSNVIEYLQANGTFSSSPIFFNMVESGSQSGVWHIIFGPGETGDVPLTNFTAMTYSCEVSMTYLSQTFMTSKDFVIMNVQPNERSVNIFAPDEVATSATTTISADVITNGTRVTLDAAPMIHIYKINSNGTATSDLTSTSMTQYSGQQSWYKDWTPAANGTYIITVTGNYLGEVIQGVRTISVRAQYTIAHGPVGEIVKIM